MKIIRIGRDRFVYYHRHRQKSCLCLIKDSPSEYDEYVFAVIRSAVNTKKGAPLEMRSAPLSVYII